VHTQVQTMEIDHSLINENNSQDRKEKEENKNNEQEIKMAEIEEPDNQYQIEKQKIENIISSVDGDKKIQHNDGLRKASVVGAYNDDLQTKYKPLNNKSCDVNNDRNNNSCMKNSKKNDKKNIGNKGQYNKKGDNKDKEENSFIIVSTKDNKNQEHNIDSGGTRKMKNNTSRIGKKTKYRKNKLKKKVNELQIMIQPDLDIDNKIKKFLDGDPTLKSKSRLIRDIEKLYIRDTID